MLKRILQFVFGSTTANIFMIAGVVLLGVALHFGINPADGSAVDPRLHETWILIFLFITTIPAMFMMIVAGDGIVGYALMYLLQVCVFWSLGRLLAFLILVMARQTRKKHS